MPSFRANHCICFYFKPRCYVNAIVQQKRIKIKHMFICTLPDLCSHFFFLVPAHSAMFLACEIHGCYITGKKILHWVIKVAIPSKSLRVNIQLIIRILTGLCESRVWSQAQAQKFCPSGNITGKPRVTHLSYKQQHLQAKELLTETQNDTKYKGLVSAMLEGRNTSENRIL